MTRLNGTAGTPETGRLKSAALICAAIWLAALVAFSFAASSFRANENGLNDAEAVLSAAIEVKSYPSRSRAAQKEPLAAVSEVIDKLELQSKVGQLSSSASGLALQANRLYADELSDLIEDLARNGLVVKTAEIRALSGGKDGRLINATLAIEGEEK